VTSHFAVSHFAVSHFLGLGLGFGFRVRVRFSAMANGEMNPDRSDHTGYGKSV